MEWQGREQLVELRRVRGLVEGVVRKCAGDAPDAKEYARSESPTPFLGLGDEQRAPLVLPHRIRGGHFEAN